MGASFAKLNCCGTIRKNKIGVATNSFEIINKIETKSRPSPEILQELQRVGIISERSGGLRFIVETLTENEMIKPRRLPAISVSNVSPRRRLADKSRASTTKEIESIYDNADKGLMVEIRRMDALADKGKMAKESERRRQAAKEKRDNRLKQKIRKTENKLKRGNRVEGAIPPPKREKRRKPAKEAEPRLIKTAVSV